MDKAREAQKRKIIVFGANGFLGSVIVRKLSGAKYEVIAVIRPNSERSRLDGIKNLILLEIESNNWPDIILLIKPSAVLCAQWDGVSKLDRQNSGKQKSNIQPLVDLANMAKQVSVESFICFGSQAECEENKEIIPELFCDSGKTEYGLAKIRLHLELNTIFKYSDCRIVWARIFSIYGPSDYSDSISFQLFECEASGQEIEILNASKPWSYLYEDDFAEAIEQILVNRKLTGVVNIGNPKLVEIRKIVDSWGGYLNVKFKEFDASQSKVGFFPEVKKLSAIRWSPEISIEEGIQRTKISIQERFSEK